MGKHDKITNRERVARRRATLRAQGLRPKQFWVHDTSQPGFWDRINRQALLIAHSPQEKEDQAWVDHMQGLVELPHWDPE